MMMDKLHRWARSRNHLYLSCLIISVLTPLSLINLYPTVSIVAILSNLCLLLISGMR